MLYLAIHQLMGWVAPTFWLLRILLLGTFTYEFLYESRFQLFGGHIPRKGITLFICFYSLLILHVVPLPDCKPQEIRAFMGFGYLGPLSEQHKLLFTGQHTNICSKK